MNRIEQIKAAQVAAGKEQGKPNPYEAAEKPVVITVKSRQVGQTLGRMAQIKAAQLAEAEKTGINPYESAVNQAAGDDQTVVKALKDLPYYQDLLKLDLEKISQVKVLEEKAELKATLLPQYLPFVTDYIEQGHDYPNNVAVQVMIWLIDSEAIEPFLNLAFALIKTGNQHMPERFKRRDLETFVCDAMCDWAAKQLKLELSASPYIDTLASIIDVDQWDVHPLCASKNFVMAAKHNEQAGDYQDGIDWCEKAKAINPEGHGCKTLQERLEKLQEKA